MKIYTLKQPAAGAPAAPPQRPHEYPDTRRQIIGEHEIKELGRASALAFAAHRREIDAEMSGSGGGFLAFAKQSCRTLKDYQDQWRHLQVKQATAGRAARLREVARADYNDVLGHFLRLAGMDAAAFRAYMRGGETRDGEPRENVRQSSNVCAEAVGRLAEVFALQVARQHPDYTAAQARDAGAARAGAYIGTIERKRFRGRRWQDLDSKGQYHMMYCVNNAIARITGKGDPANRHKKQRQTPRAPRAETAPAPRTNPAAARPAARHFTAD